MGLYLISNLAYGVCLIEEEKEEEKNFTEISCPNDFQILHYKDIETDEFKGFIALSSTILKIADQKEMSGLFPVRELTSEEFLRVKNVYPERRSGWYIVTNVS